MTGFVRPKGDYEFDNDGDDFSIFTYYEDGKPHMEIIIYPKPNKFVLWWRSTRLYYWLFWKHYKLER